MQHLGLTYVPAAAAQHFPSVERAEKLQHALLLTEENCVRTLSAEFTVPTEAHAFAKLLAKQLACVEYLVQQPALQLPVAASRAAWACEARWRKHVMVARAHLDNEQRVHAWKLRLRCVYLASTVCVEQFAAAAKGEDNSSSTSTSTSASTTTRELRQARVDAVRDIVDDVRNDKELFVALSVLWPVDTRQRTLSAWCEARRLLLHTVRDVDDELRACSLVACWQLLKVLLKQWAELEYCAQLVAYVWRLVEQVARLAALTGDSRTYNHPLYAQRYDSDEYAANTRFYVETERTLYALQQRLYKCAHLQWPQPLAALRRGVTDPFAGVEFHEHDAVRRFNAFIGEQLAADSRFVQYIERDFHVLLCDFLLYPGEMERFEALHPDQDRRPMTCLAKMRRTDFDRYERLLLQPSVADAWTYLLDYDTHPAYTLLASRAIQYYFDATYDGASFDAYFVDVERVPLEHLRANACAAFRDFNADLSAPLTRGSCEHALGGTFVRSGMQCTRDSQLPHPLIVRCVGASHVFYGKDMCAVRAFSQYNTFAGAFLVWLYVFCADAALCGTLANGHCVGELLRTLAPTRDSAHVADRCASVRRRVLAVRASMTGFEDSVRELAAACAPPAPDVVDKCVEFKTE